MQILRVLALVSLAASTSPALAQSSPDNKTLPPEARTFSLVPSPDFRLPLPLPQHLFRGAQSSLLQGTNLPHLTLNGTQNSQPQTYLRLLSPTLPHNRLLSTQKNQQCYAMRSYRFNRDNPASDTTDLAEYSICQPAADFQMKAALDIHTR